MTTTDYWKKATLLAAGETEEKASKKSEIAVIASKVTNICPRCYSLMSEVVLTSSKRKAYYCANDRVTMPLPITE